MAIATPTTGSTAEANPASLPADAISYEDLYARWERGNWSATELDFTEDARQWREDFTEFERTGRAVELLPVLLGRGRGRGQPLALHRRRAAARSRSTSSTTQQVDEARHAVFFKRFMQEVCGIGRRLDGQRPAGDQAAADPRLSQDLRPPRQDGRRAARRPLAGPARRGGDALPHRDRGLARAARPALHLQLPGGARPAARLPPGHGEHRRRRAAPHRLRREAALRPQARRPRRSSQGGRPDCCAKSPATPPRC